MKKSGIVVIVVGIIVLVLYVLAAGYGISSYVEEKKYEHPILNVSEINIKEDVFSGDIVYIEELYVLERYVSVTHYSNSDIDDYEEPTYHLNTSTDYPKEGSTGFFDTSNIVDFERFTVMFYDATGTPYVTTLEKTGANDISVLLGKSGGKPVKISLYVEVNGDFTQSVGFEKHYSEVSELKEKSLTKCAKEHNAQIADYNLNEDGSFVDRLIYVGETVEDVQGTYDFDSGMELVFVLLPAVIIAVVIAFGFIKRLKKKKSENID